MSLGPMAAQKEAAILNEYMMTIHRPQPDGGRYETSCGHRFPLGHDHLRLTTVDEAADSHTASKCGDCFEEGGGY